MIYNKYPLICKIRWTHNKCRLFGLINEHKYLTFNGHNHIWNKHQFSQGLAPALHTAGLARNPAGGRAGLMNASFGPQVLVFVGTCCPGPGSSWGNLAAPPASTDVKSPTMSFHLPPCLISIDDSPGLLHWYILDVP